MTDVAAVTDLRNETAKRRTFAIISHPDAGKTTLTEKLLLYSGMIRTAGMVKNRKGGTLATSDWMTMEQERGISITSSAMQFPYKGYTINILDTPGHQDFSEDTYRTLTAADSAIMVIDAAKGVETQTKKLFAVCRLRGIPVLTFVNKLDLPGRDPLELMTEVEEVLGIQACAMNWPIGSGREFVGVADRRTRELSLFTKAAVGGAARANMTTVGIDSPEALAALGAERRAKLADDLEMLEIAGNPFSLEEFRAGKVSPVFFGSAFTNFGIEPFYDAFVELAQAPSARPVTLIGGNEPRALDPITSPFSAYVFKIQANMDPKHRDSLAFIRICSGKFDRDLVVKHFHRGELVREVRLSRPATLVAKERSTLDEAFPGDVVGLINAGFAIGDTLSVKAGFEHQPLPQFPPEHFARIEPADLTKRKGFDKGMETLAGEGAVQVLRSYDNPIANPFIAAVGRLQFEVLQYRLETEYNAEARREPAPFQVVRWLPADTRDEDLEGISLPTGGRFATDVEGNWVALFPTEWSLSYFSQNNPKLGLSPLAPKRSVV